MAERWGAWRCLGAAAVVMAAAGCWGQPGFNARHQGSNPLESALTPDTVAGLAPAWTARVDAGPVRADPVLTGGLDAVLVSDDGAAYALDVATGARRWRTPVVPAGGPAALVAGPVTVDGGEALVPWGGGAADSGAVARLAVGDGHVVGQVSTAGPLSVTARSPWRATSTSGFVETTLPFGAVRIEGPVPWFLVTQFGNPSDPRPSPTAATLTADRFFVGLGTGFYGANVLDAWDLDRNCPVSGPEPQPAICQPDLRTQLDGLPTTPVVDDAEATVYVATAAGTVYAVDAASGAVRWTAPAGAPVHQQPALGAGGLFVATDDGRLLTFDPAGCGAAACAATRTIALPGPPDTPPAVAGGVVYAASDGTLAAYPAAGPAPDAPLWSAALGSPVTGGPTVAVGTLYAGTADGRVVAYRAGPGG